MISSLLSPKDHYELQRLHALQILEDPLKYSIRAQQRARHILPSLEEKLIDIYNGESLPQTASFYSRWARDIVLVGNLVQNHASISHYRFNINQQLYFMLRQQEHIGHLSLAPSKHRCPLLWAADIAYEMICEIAFEQLNIRVVQTFTPRSLTHILSFQQVSDRWWVLTRQQYEHRKFSD